MKTNRTSLLVAACGTAFGLAGTALAQPDIIHVSGATLLENLFRARAATVDYIDVDGNKIARGFPTSTNQQLAPFALPPYPPVADQTGFPSNLYWGVMYSSIGSTNGFNELLRYGRAYVRVQGTVSDAAQSLPIATRSAAYYNRYRFIRAGAINDESTDVDPITLQPRNAEVTLSTPPIFNSSNPGGMPLRQRVDGSFSALFSTPNQGSTLGDPADQFEPMLLDSNLDGTPNNLTAGSGFRDTNANGTWDNLNFATVNTRGGMGVDLAVLDVPTTWATTQSVGTADWFNNPLQGGYGNAPSTRQPVDKNGLRTAGGSRVITLGLLVTPPAPAGAAAPVLFNPANPAPAATADNIIFDASIVLAPVAPVTSFGSNLEEIRLSDLRHLYTTGRARNGVNFTAVTRDTGSGTRNAWDNSLGIDPSWNSGDNVGPRNNASDADNLGPAFLPSHKGGNPRVEFTTINNRIAIGYVGPERGIDNADGPWLTLGRLEVLAVQNDALYGGTQFSRPTIGDVLDNDANGWVIYGPAVLASYGSPASAPAAKGGLGWNELFTDLNSNNAYDMGEPFIDFNGNGVWGPAETRPESEPFVDTNGDGVRNVGESFTDSGILSVPGSAGNGVWDSKLLPAMRNPEAAAFVNNFERSITAFEELPGSDQTVFTPGEFAATQYVLINAVDNLKQTSPSIDPTVNVTNPGLNQTLQDFIRNEAGNILGNSAFNAFGNTVAPNTANSRAGKVPTRVHRVRTSSVGTTAVFSAVNYFDGVTGDASTSTNPNPFYTIQDSALIAPGETTAGRVTYGNNLPLRNLTTGDFNADGVVNWMDAEEMVKAYREFYESTPWTPPAASGELAALSTLTGQSVDPGLTAVGVIGDFDGDGNFTAADIRFFADGFATDPVTGNLNRAEGFERIDEAYRIATDPDGMGPLEGDNNFFNTTLATPAAYAPGDARGDIANASGRVTPGWAPTGHDGGAAYNLVATNVTPPQVTAVAAVADAGRIDAADIDYVFRQFVNNPRVTDGALNWDSIDEAVGSDLSADITGDLIIDQADVVELVTGILKTKMGDFNLDGSTSAEDRVIQFNNHGGTTRGWATGDIDGNRTVDSQDIDGFYTGHGCKADFNIDGTLNDDDLGEFITSYFEVFAGGPGGVGYSQPCPDAEAPYTTLGYRADFTLDCSLNDDDLGAFITAFFNGCEF